MNVYSIVVCFLRLAKALYLSVYKQRRHDLFYLLLTTISCHVTVHI